MNKTIHTTTFVGKLCGILLMLLSATPVLATESGDSNKTVSGVVTDSKTGDPLIGVTVSVMRNGKVDTGVITDFDGHFSMPTPVGEYEVHISYMGYQTIILKPSRDKMENAHVRMVEESNALSDVVVTGFFNKSKSSFTGAVTSMSGIELKQVSGVNIVNAIAALTPGMNMVQNTSQGSNPNHVPELVLRGVTSFSNEGQSVNQPTIILDGSEITMQDLYDLDINEVENITVLKDASATALYGSKAANGVIVITRKPLAEGTLRVQYNFTGNLQTPILSDYNVLNAKDKLLYEQMAGLYDGKGNIEEQYRLDELYNERYKLVMAGQDSDWLAQPARTSFSHDHSLRIYGGAQNLRYELTGRFADTKGVMKADYRHRYNLGFKLDYFVNNSIQISNRTTYSEIKVQNTPYGSFSEYVEMNPYERMYNDDGTPNVNLSWDLDNPLYEASLGSHDRNGTNTFTNITDFRWDINKMFRLTGHFNITSETGWSDIFVSPKSRTFKNITDLTKKGLSTQINSDGTSYNGNIVGTFNKFFDDESLISANAGWEINLSNAASTTMEAVGFFNDKNSYIGNAAGYPSGTNARPIGNSSESADVGVFVTANASWRNRYFADGTWRTTGSSQFGENNRYGHFWSGGLGWNILNEPFMEGVKKHFDLFKLRSSAGYTGKVSFNPFQAMTMYEYSNIYEYKYGIGAVPKTIGNVNLCWERTMTYNTGLDFSMFGNRLNLVVDAYIRKTTDLLLDRSYAPSTGVTSAKANLGEMENKGIELQIDGYIFRNNNFSWKLGAMGSMNKNKITQINKALEEINKQNQADAYTSLAPLPQYAEGESVTALKLVQSAGIDPATGKEIYVKRDGTLSFKYDPVDRVLIGDTEPIYNGNFSTHVYWKGFSVYALANCRFGAWVYNTTRASKVEGSDPRYNADQRVFDDRWKEPGNVAFYKDIADSSRPEQTTRFAELENTLTLGSLNISYQFSEDVCKKLHVRNLRTGINFTDILRLSTVKIERGTSYLYSQGFEMNLSATF